MATLNDTVGDISQLMGWLRELKDRSTNSLTAYTKKTHITSRVYIEDVISREDGIKPIVNMCNHIYGGLIFSAISLNNTIANGRTVRQMVDMVSTEDFHNFIDLIRDKFGDKNVKLSIGLEDNNQNNQKKNSNNNQNNQKKDDDKNTDEKKDDEKKDKKTFSANEVELKKQLFSGRLVECKIKTGPKEELSLYFFVQLIPYVTSSTVLKQFVSNHFNPSFMSRFAKWRAGEISFWKDFLFEADLIEKRRKALKSDKDGVLREIEDRRNGQLKKALKSMSFIFSRNNNSASSIIVISKRSIDRFMKDNGMDYRRYDTRQKIMEGTFSMMLVVYDPDYDQVEMYLNGYQNAGTYSVAQLTDSFKSDKGDAMDLKTLMSILQAGNIPKF